MFTTFSPDFAGPFEPDPAIFPSALAAQALADCPEASSLVARLQDFLLSERDSSGGWTHWPRDHQFAGWLPADLDDTSCSAGALGSRVETAPLVHLLLDNRRRDGLFLTWVIPRPASARGLRQIFRTGLQFRRLPGLLSLFRTTSARPADVDAVVNANCLYFLGERAETQPVQDWIGRILREGREIVCDKWYDDPHLVRYFFARALSRCSNAPAERQALLRRIGEGRPRTALNHACDAAAMAMLGEDPSCPVATLLKIQRSDGLWDGAAVYHGGRLRDPEGEFLPKHPDTPHWGSELLTTALCVQALSLARKQIVHSASSYSNA